MPSTYSSARACFEAALELPAVSRAAFLLKHCGETDLRQRVTRMLAAHDGGSGGVLDLPLVAIAETLADPLRSLQAQAWIGRSVGGVRLLDVLGQGGSAVVFRGEKKQQDVCQIVAVKLFRKLLLTDFDLRQFRRERMAMAQLSHPNIARLIDGGCTETGMAYIVLEFVDGSRITDYADNRHLDQRQRLRLLVEVCRTVDAAHRALIVHRDLKPSNVLMTRDGHVKLLDFGIAKFLDDDDATEAADRALTPAYAAPEQFRGEPVTTATDVYALGVLLGELLTGMRLASEYRDAPRDNSGDTAAAALLQQLSGDIGSIFLMATAADPQRRYASAGVLADDLECLLASRPVRAHPPSRTYRLARFCARNRVGLSVVAMLGGLVITAAGIALWQARAATAHAARAQTEAALARATRDFMVELFRLAEPAGARAAPVTVIEVAEAALSRLDNAAQMDARVRLDLKTQLGAVLRGQSRLSRSQDVLRAAAAEGTQVFGSADPMVVEARLELGEALLTAGDYAAAAALTQAMRGDALRQDSDRQVKYLVLDATVAGRRGNAADAMQRITEAAEHCGTACSDAVRFQLLNAKGDVYGMFDRNVVAAESFEQAAALATTLYGPVHARMASALDGLAGAYNRVGRADDARRIAQQVLAIDDRIGVPAVHWQRALHLNRLGTALYALGEYDAALQAFEQGIAISRQVSSEDDQSLAIDIRNIGIVYYRLGKFEDSIRHLSDALARHVASSGEHHRDVAHLRANLAGIMADGGDATTAVTMVQQAVDDLRAQGEGSERRLAEALLHSARIFLLDGDAGRALSRVDEAIAMFENLVRDTRESTRLHAHITRGVALARLARPVQARQALEPALRRLGEIGKDDHSQAEAHFVLGLLALEEKHCDSAGERLAAGRQALTRKPFVYAYLRSEESALATAVMQRCR